jgi:hypothetical protein
MGEILRDPGLLALGEGHGRDAVLRQVRVLLDEARLLAAAGDEAHAEARILALTGAGG